MAGLEGCCTFPLSAGLRAKAQGAAALPASPWQILQLVEKTHPERMLGVFQSQGSFISVKPVVHDCLKIKRGCYEEATRVSKLPHHSSTPPVPISHTHTHIPKCPNLLERSPVSLDRLLQLSCARPPSSPRSLVGIVQPVSPPARGKLLTCMLSLNGSLSIKSIFPFWKHSLSPTSF